MPVDIPLATAVSIPEDAFHSSMVYATDDVIVLGGDAFISDDASLVPLPAPQPSAPPEEDLAPQPEFKMQSQVSIERLLEEMVSSISDYDIICNKLRDERWQSLLRSITADEFGCIIIHVNIEMDQPRVAVLLATHMNSAFTCAHAAAAIQNAAEWTRYTMVERLLPLCSDFSTNQRLVREQLNVWELTVTQQYFDAAAR
jgi:hypothetical protein